ncbi:hypothetical protein AFR_36465 [Actinoplanes friuliensis DSM 7358]|uniref:Uncharacterized protein n=1 Tax=Actinoplanes friuliensis DSM 7358 TaxID=1246995 RepID=U5W8V8_9ACTN|nr:hypothetical protein AFR_36465 [Actinoplanes friuliensis DSM 7358]
MAVVPPDEGFVASDRDGVGEDVTGLDDDVTGLDDDADAVGEDADGETGEGDPRSDAAGGADPVWPPHAAWVRSPASTTKTADTRWKETRFRTDFSLLMGGVVPRQPSVGRVARP